jgi:hypothetical protein
MNVRSEKYVCICFDRWLWKPFRLPKYCLHWYNSAKRQWMTFPPGIMWGCFGSLDVLGYEEMKLPTSSQETALFKSLSDLNQPWGSLDKL